MNPKLNLVGLAEIARMLDLPRSTVRVWRVRGHLPAPYTELASGPIWERKTIEEWARESLRPISVR
jgi:hypothetical protein